MLSGRSSPSLVADPFPPALPSWKRALDLLCCALALPFFAVAWLLVASLLALTSPGRVFFRQERVGYMGHRFWLYKFRTMHEKADHTAHEAHIAALLRGNQPMRKLDGARDTRLVPGGWILRATGLDELPQLINVLRGEMSIVGPRPCIPYEFEQYTPSQRRRCRAMPGLTGLWQVSGKNRTTFDEMVQYDVHYAQARSLVFDLLIIARTLPALCGQLVDTRAQRRTSPASRATCAAEPPGDTELQAPSRT